MDKKLRDVKISNLFFKWL